MSYRSDQLLLREAANRQIDRKTDRQKDGQTDKRLTLRNPPDGGN